MKCLTWFFLSSILIIFSGCAVKPAIQNEYQLTGYSNKRFVKYPVATSIIIETPEAMAGYRSVDMLYVKKRYELDNFAHNSWTSPPADMLLPLVVQSITSSNYFRVVAASPSPEITDYRLNLQLLVLQQSFLTRPSQLQLSIQAVLIRTKTNRPIASRIFTYQIPCTMDTPYGGVIAANQGLRLFTAELTHFIVRQVNVSRSK